MSIEQNIPFAAYRRLPGLHATALKHLLRSPLQYRWAMDHPDDTDTPAKALGRATHTAILEPHKLLTSYALWEGGRRAGKAWDEFCAANEARQILTVEEFGAIQAMRDSVRGFTPAMRYLATGEAEVTIQWEMLGRLFKGRIDWLTKIDGRTVITDLKTTRDARPFKFGNDAHRLGYHIQFALYHDGWYELTGENPLVVVLAVENKEPHEPAVFRVPEEVLEQGRDDYTRLLRTLGECENANLWPPSCEEEQTLSLPTYAYGDDSDVSDLGLSA